LKRLVFGVVVDGEVVVIGAVDAAAAAGLLVEGVVVAAAAVDVAVAAAVVELPVDDYPVGCLAFF
jgi:hypothetical protein